MAALLIAAEDNTQSEKMQALLAVLQSDELNEYVKLALHSYEQVRDWLRKNANTRIKQMAGIK